MSKTADEGIALNALTPADFAALPAELRETMRQAAKKRAYGELLKLTRQIPSSNTSVAGVMEKLVRQMNYKRLLKLLGE